MKTTNLIGIVFCLITLLSNAQTTDRTQDISGKWLVNLEKNLDTDDSQDTWDKKEGEITLPGSLAQNGYGVKTEGSDFGILTPTHKFVGIANYKKEIIIPKNWKKKNITLFLERVLWESRVFIDGKELSVQDALGTPHIHELGELSSGKHTLEVKVNNDMIHNIGDKGHAYGDYTQSIWNGIVGRIELIAKDPTFISSVQVHSNIDTDELKLNLDIESSFKGDAEIIFEIVEVDAGQVMEDSFTQKLVEGKNKKELVLKLDGKLKKWNEFDPTVYILTTTLKTRKHEDQHTTEFGYLKISHNGTNVLINDQPVFLRGNLDCVHFPLTGYASATLEDWIRIFQIYKDYGLNHVRYHSWCPPEAAFKAANRVGIYMQAEASIWIDWWMSEDMKVKGRPHMDTKGYPQGLGKDPKRDEFVISEMNRVVDYYGNHPSFTMFCIGNELGNSDFDIMEQWIADLKKKDPRRLYAVSTARKIMDVDDYSATHYIQNIGRTRGLNGAGTDWDFEDVYNQMNIPIIAHEIGQWPVYPVWEEIEKYSGVLKARNFEEFRVVAEKNGIVDQDEDFKNASGALNQLMYKYETESFLRTKSCAGVQLLSMQDYQGQGEALIGWLDAHWETKGITTPEKFKEHFSETVPLLRIQKFIWSNNELLEAKVQLSHYGQYDISNGELICKVSNPSGVVIKERSWPINKVAVGELLDVGNISMDLNVIEEAQRLKISIELKNTSFKNEWDVWVYPAKLPEVIDNDIIVTDKINDATLLALKNGEKVLLQAHNLGNDELSVPVDFFPLYWSLTFFPGQGKTSIGMLLKEDHPAFTNFPTSFHSDWQWEPFKKSTRGFILNDMPVEYKPIAQVVDDFHRNNKEGAIFEFKVGEGKLLISGFDLTNAESVVSKQLKYSLINYMNTDDFNPEQSVSEAYLKNLFTYVPQAEQISIKGEFENEILRVNAAENLKDIETNKPWDKSTDLIEVAVDGTSYKVHADGVWKDNNVSAWHGQELQIEVNCPSGILGSFYVLLNDWNNKGREGVLEFEGRKVKLGAHSGKDGKWVKFHVMREDSNDGNLKLKASMTKGGNLMVSKIVLVKD